MRINIHSKNIDLNDEQKGYIESKIMKIAHHGGRVDDESSEIRVEVDQVTTRHSQNPIAIEVTMYVPHAVIRAEDEADTVEAAVDLVELKLEKQVERYKSKMHRRDKQGKWIPQSTLEEMVADEEIEEYEVPKILRRKRLDDLKPMHEEEAIEHMELLGHNFFLFYNEDTERVSVLYKRDGGSYGILEPHMKQEFSYAKES